MKWFLELTNRALNKLTGRRGLNWDRRHRRYYFQPAKPGEEYEVSYQPLNQNRTKRSVVWQPVNKRTGEGRHFWYHRAVALRFARIGNEDWCLGIRPELHVTTDGMRPLQSDKIGSKVTKKKSRMFNYDLLGEVQFWRDFLSGSSPRIILRFGPQTSGQHLVVSTTLMSGTVRWPGIPDEHAKPFKNVEYVDNLLTWAEFAQLDMEADDDDRWDHSQEESDS